MSHFSRVRTIIRDQQLLVQALTQLSYRFKIGERLPIKGYQGNTEYGQIVIDTGSRYDIGLQLQADGSFAVCADWWGVEHHSKLNETRFIDQLNRKYAHLTVKAQVLAQGYIIEQETVLDNGEIELLVSERF